MIRPPNRTEPPFGTIKRAMGHGYFLMKGMHKSSTIKARSLTAEGAEFLEEAKKNSLCVNLCSSAVKNQHDATARLHIPVSARP